MWRFVCVVICSVFIVQIKTEWGIVSDMFSKIRMNVKSGGIDLHDGTAVYACCYSKRMYACSGNMQLLCNVHSRKIPLYK